LWRASEKAPAEGGTGFAIGLDRLLIYVLRGVCRATF
jgi:hypothetical protein